METDSIWKEMLETLFKEFLQFFFPKVHADIDFGRGYQFLDKEFQKISRDAKSGRKIVDKLVKVFLKDGKEEWLLIHIEIQGQKKKDFARRMYTYNYRIFDKFQRNVVSLALLTDRNQYYRPYEFKFEKWDFALNFKFPLVKIIDYINYDFEKEYRKNPFSLLVQAYLKTMETENHEFRRFEWKKRFIGALHDLGFDHKTLYNLFRFIEWIMELPEELEDKLYLEILEMKGEKDMSFMTILEKKSMEKGLEKGMKEGLKKGVRQGIIQGRQDAILAVLEVKFRKPSKNVAKLIRKIQSLEALDRLLEHAKLANSLDDFTATLKKEYKNF